MFNFAFILRQQRDMLPVIKGTRQQVNKKEQKIKN